MLSVLLVVCCFSSLASTAPLLQYDDPNVIPGAYIVILKDGLTIADRDMHINALQNEISSTGAVASVDYKYNINGMLGFSAKLPENLLKSELAHPDVKYIEADKTIVLDNYQKHQPNTLSNTVITQVGASWGLVRISQHDSNLSAPYIYNANGGEGVDVYLLDTGVLIEHVDFGGRAIYAYNAYPNETPSDIIGAGTHNAGIIMGTVYGVAKRARLLSVKIYHYHSPISGYIAGVDYVTNNFTKSRPSLAVLTLYGSSTALVEAVTKSREAGMVYISFAGNDNANVCNYALQRAATLAVGSINNLDTRSSFSSFGPCLSFFAPGQQITSDYIGSIYATNTLSGTSASAAFAAGVYALQLSISPSRLPSFLTSQATPGKVINPGAGSANLLLFSPT